MKYSKVKVVKHYMGGGGGGSNVTAPTIPEWAVPYAQDILGETKGLYTSGDLGRVAGYNDNLISAGVEGAEGLKGFTRQAAQDLGTQKDRILTGLDGNADATNKQMALALGQQTAVNNANFGANGVLGSARNVNANANAAAEGGVKAAQQIFNNKVTTEQGLDTNIQNSQALITGTTKTVADLGQQQRAIEQQMADSKLKAIQTAAGIFTGATPKEQVVPNQGGGK